MRVLQCVGAAALCSWLASAQSTAKSSSTLATSTTSSVAPPATYTISVGLGTNGFSYIPQSQNANVGDTIAFQFFPQNHSVARAEFLNPCVPYEYNGGGRVGFWSGFEPVENANSNLPIWKLRINDTAPIFFYCSAPDACVPNAMVGVINPNGTQTLAAQILSVKSATYQLSPGDPLPAESSSKPTPSPTSSPTSAPVSGGGGLSGGAIAGIVVGAVVLLAVAGVALYLWGRNRSLGTALRYSRPPQPRHPDLSSRDPYSPAPPSSTAYSPDFPKPNPVTSVGLTSRETWNSYSGGPPNRPISPEMSDQGQPSPDQRSTFSGGYNAVENPANAHFRIQSSPTETPWSPGGFGLAQRQYAQIPPAHEAAGTSTSLGPQSGQGNSGYDPGRGASYASRAARSPLVSGPHELDSQSHEPDPYQQPPQYRPRAFSFDQGGEAPRGVEKVLRD